MCSYFNISYCLFTGLFDNATKHQFCVPRCDFPDYMTTKSARVKRYKLGKFITSIYLLTRQTVSVNNFFFLQTVERNRAHVAS